MSRFVINADNTVTDTTTGLTWTRETVAGDVTHEQGKAAAEALGAGWRLPTLHELFAIADHTRHSPAIDTEAFPDTARDWYWTDTPAARGTSAVWVVDFDDGLAYVNPRLNDACVRAVRSSPPKSVVREPVYLPPEFSASIRLRSQEEAAPKPPPPPPWYREHWQNLAVVIAVAFLAGVCWSSWPGLDRLAAFVGL